jgi:hypothetical protein
MLRERPPCKRQTGNHNSEFRVSDADVQAIFSSSGISVDGEPLGIL